jgi:hypothetical protein
LLFTFYCCNIAAELDFLKDSFEVNNPIYNQHQGCYNALYIAFFKYLPPPPRLRNVCKERQLTSIAGVSSGAYCKHYHITLFWPSLTILCLQQQA